jgi:hypothetical protein
MEILIFAYIICYNQLAGAEIFFQRAGADKMEKISLYGGTTNEHQSWHQWLRPHRPSGFQGRRGFRRY